MTGTIPTTPEEIKTAALGMAILSAITLTLFALWAEYFKAYLETELKRDPRLDLTQERFKVRIAGLLVVIFQLTLFLGSYPVRKVYPLKSAALFGIIFLLQSAIQTAIEKSFSVRETALKTPKDIAKSGGKGFLWLSVFAGVYATCALTCIGTSLLIAKLLHLNAIGSAVCVFAGSIIGIALGIAGSFALAPRLLRNILPAEPIAHSKHFEQIATAFAECGIRIPQLYQVDFGASNSGAVIISGFHWGRGLFRPALFISKYALEELTPGELRSVILHEVGHIALKHLRNRWVLSSLLVLTLTTVAALLVFVGEIFLNGNPIQAVVGPVAGLCAFVAASYLLSAQSRFQEIQADIFSVKHQRGKTSALIEALKKLEKMNPPRPATSFLSMKTHPPVELRIKVLEKYFASAQSESVKDSERKSPKKAA